MKTKKFILQLEFPENTRWLHSDDQLLHSLASLARSIVTAATEGPRPAVSIVQDNASANRRD